MELVQRFGEHHHLSPPFRLHRLCKLPNEGQHGVAPAKDEMMVFDDDSVASVAELGHEIDDIVHDETDDGGGVDDANERHKEAEELQSRVFEIPDIAGVRKDAHSGPERSILTRSEEDQSADEQDDGENTQEERDLFIRPTGQVKEVITWSGLARLNEGFKFLRRLILDMRQAVMLQASVGWLEVRG